MNSWITNLVARIFASTIKPELKIKLEDQGPEVEKLQQALIDRGYDLPRFGVDGVCGAETLATVGLYQTKTGQDFGETAEDMGGVGPKTYAAITEPPFERFDEPSPPVTEAEGMVFLVSPDEAGKTSVSERPWSKINGITLHQTATLIGETPEQWRGVHAHLGVTRQGKRILINGLNQTVWHGNALNAHTVGVEIDGHFEGIEGDLSTYWRPKSRPNRMPLTPTTTQIEAARKTIKWIIQTVAAHGGKVEFIHAHRQSSKMRTSDPGSRIWRDVGLWAKSSCNLKDGGPKFSVGGYPIPKEWDPLYTSRYKRPTS